MRSRPQTSVPALLLAWALIAAGLLAALPALLARHGAESGSRQVDLVMEFSSARKLAMQEGYPFDQLLKDLRAAGITSVAIIEQNMEELRNSGDGAVVMGHELRSRMAAAVRPNPFLARLSREGLIYENHTYVLPASPAVAERVYATLSGGLPAGRVTWHRPAAGEDSGTLDGGIIGIDAPAQLIQEFGMGYSERDFARAHAAGLRVVARPRNLPQYTPEGIHDYFERLAALAPELNTIIPFGRQVLGYRPEAPEVLEATIAEFRQRDWIFGAIEHYTQLGYSDQAGLHQVSAALDYRVSRVYGLGQNELDKYLPETSVDKWHKSVLERNIRSLYLRPLFVWQDPGETVIETNLKYFRMLVEQLRAYGYEPGGPAPFARVTIPWWQRGLAGLGVVGAGLLWLGLTFPVAGRHLVGLGLIGSAGVLALPRVMPNTGPELLALAAAILFPTAAATLLLHRWRERTAAAASAGRAEAGAGAAPPGASQPGASQLDAVTGRTLFREGALALIVLGGLSLVGGLLVAGLLGDSPYILEFRYFRGVKIAFATPLALVAVSYLVMGRRGRPGEVFRAIIRELWGALDMAIRYKHVVLGMIGLVGLFWYIQRSGNFPVVPVPDWERKLRFWLEQTLIARPRFKEFVIGYPALALAVAAACRGWRGWVLPLLIVGTSAGVSVCNSFSHLRTPVLISLLRTVHGFWIGALVGLAGTAVILYFLRWVTRPEDRRQTI